jgi:hypothetical protein
MNESVVEAGRKIARVAALRPVAGDMAGPGRDARPNGGRLARMASRRRATTLGRGLPRI